MNGVTCSILGGCFEGNIELSSNSTLNISGGTIIGNIESESDSIVSITKGIFSTDPTEYLAVGSTAELEGGLWFVHMSGQVLDPIE